MRIFAVLASLALALPASAGGWYASVYGGINADDVIDVAFVESQTGAVVGGTVGRSTPVPGLRIEADLSYRTNDVEIFGGAINAAHDTTALLFNVAYDLDVDNDPVKPFIFVGIGGATTEATFENVALLRLEASGIAYQAGAGLNTAIWPGASIGVSYRFLQAPKVETLGVELSDGTNHSIVAQLTFDL
jgi:opacity protein-like surface antigen